ncbi:MAG TPA: hypothetical protein VIU62_20540, partial [Chloroflexota bacterium]
MRRDALVTPPVGTYPVLPTQQSASVPPASSGVHLGERLVPAQGSPVMLTVTDVRQYFYCPRIVYYRLCQPLRRPLTYKMREGKLAQDRTADLEHQRSLRAYGLTTGERHFNVSLRSELLGMQGIIDM